MDSETRRKRYSSCTTSTGNNRGGQEGIAGRKKRGDESVLCPKFVGVVVGYYEPRNQHIHTLLLGGRGERDLL